MTSALPIRNTSFGLPRYRFILRKEVRQPKKIKPEVCSWSTTNCALDIFNLEEVDHAHTLQTKILCKLEVCHQVHYEVQTWNLQSRFVLNRRFATELTSNCKHEVYSLGSIVNLMSAGGLHMTNKTFAIRGKTVVCNQVDHESVEHEVTRGWFANVVLTMLLPVCCKTGLQMWSDEFMNWLIFFLCCFPWTDLSATRTFCSINWW